MKNKIRKTWIDISLSSLINIDKRTFLIKFIFSYLKFQYIENQMSGLTKYKNLNLVQIKSKSFVVSLIFILCSAHYT